MTTLANLVGKTPTGRNLPRARQRHSQRGVVLIIALVMLVIISLLAVSSMRNSGSTEEVLGNVRTTELATQAAEIALRRCEGLALGGGIQLVADYAAPVVVLTGKGDCSAVVGVGNDRHLLPAR